MSNRDRCTGGGHAQVTTVCQETAILRVSERIILLGDPASCHTVSLPALHRPAFLHHMQRTNGST